jgi:hypothetical protein
MPSTLKTLRNLIYVAVIHLIEISLHQQLKAVVESKEFHLGTSESYARTGIQHYDGYRSAFAFHHETLGIAEFQVSGFVQPLL